MEFLTGQRGRRRGFLGSGSVSEHVRRAVPISDLKSQRDWFVSSIWPDTIPCTPLGGVGGVCYARPSWVVGRTARPVMRLAGKRLLN